MQEDKNGVHRADMDTEMLGSTDSATCLEQGQCDPLGGHSVLGWMPQANADLPTTLVLAQIDGMGLMHENIIVRIP